MTNPSLIKLLSSTPDGNERELKLLEDICISCINISLARYCFEYEKIIIGAVKQCRYYTNAYSTLDKFLEDDNEKW